MDKDQRLSEGPVEAAERGAPAPPLSLPRWNMQEAGVVTPPRREVDGHGGLRAPGSRLPPRGTRVAPQIFTEARDKGVVRRGASVGALADFGDRGSGG